ncbi:DUF350 domain-containing protein [Psychromonas aquatilis]|uniref:DUF350 domain-containing protein n=1 Tax=Psychromonas aquatilis TaxID=2005072 RepID=A0ABU9GN75_9GAMM
MNELLAVLEERSGLIAYLAIDMAIAIILLGGIRYIMGVINKVDTADELAKKDNFAFGISMAGGVAGMGIALSGAVTGELAGSLSIEFIGMLAYGVAGLILIKAGGYIHDKFALSTFDKREQISERNISVGIVDAASVIATAIVVRASIIWVDGLNTDTFVALTAAWVVSQIMLVIITRLFEWQYSKNNGITFQNALVTGHLALAIRYSGYLISTAMSVTAASHFIEFDITSLWLGISQWVVISVVLMVLLTILTTFAKYLVLFGINRQDEVENQQNIGIATIELATSFAIALILMGLMA